MRGMCSRSAAHQRGRRTTSREATATAVDRGGPPAQPVLPWPRQAVRTHLHGRDALPLRRQLIRQVLVASIRLSALSSGLLRLLLRQRMARGSRPELPRMSPAEWCSRAPPRHAHGRLLCTFRGSSSCSAASNSVSRVTAARQQLSLRASTATSTLHKASPS